MPLVVSAAELLAGIPARLRSDYVHGRVPADEHGTTRGFNRHKREDTKACRPCLDAENKRKRSKTAQGAARAVVREHGTVRGFNQHKTAGESPCNRCRYANANAKAGRS